MSLPTLYANAKAATATAPQLAAQLRAENRRIFQTRRVGVPSFLDPGRTKTPALGRSVSRVDGVKRPLLTPL